jgi:hypothetical protein
MNMSMNDSTTGCSSHNFVSCISYFSIQELIVNMSVTKIE